MEEDPRTIDASTYMLALFVFLQAYLVYIIYLFATGEGSAAQTGLFIYVLVSAISVYQFYATSPGDLERAIDRVKALFSRRGQPPPEP